MSDDKNKPGVAANIVGFGVVALILFYIFSPSDKDTEKTINHSNLTTEEIVSTLKAIPVERYSENQSYYKELVKRFPNNSHYKEKLAFYEKKISDQQAVLDRKSLIDKQFSAWSGSHRNLESLIEKNLKDPDSYEHIETGYFDRGDHLIVQTKYRARNGFGGMTVGYIKAKTSLDGKILEIIEER